MVEHRVGKHASVVRGWLSVHTGLPVTGGYRDGVLMYRLGVAECHLAVKIFQAGGQVVARYDVWRDGRKVLEDQELGRHRTGSVIGFHRWVAEVEAGLDVAVAVLDEFS